MSGSKIFSSIDTTYTKTMHFREYLENLIEGSVGYRKTAFQTALSSLKQFGKPELTLEDARKLKGFGKGILTRLDDFIKNPPKSTSNLMKLFTGVFSIGPVKAQKFIDKGYSSLNDIPENELTQVQKFGIKFYNDINSRIPRDEISQIEDILTVYTETFNKEFDYEVKFEICGSYSRGAKDSGDIDIIITEKNDKDFINEYLACNEIVKYILAKGSSKVLCLGSLYPEKSVKNIMRRIDFEICKYKSWWFAKLYFTGSKSTNKMMRTKALELGYTLNEKGLKINKNDKFIDVSSEKEIFYLLNLDYIPPHNR